MSVIAKGKRLLEELPDDQSRQRVLAYWGEVFFPTLRGNPAAQAFLHGLGTRD